MRVGTHAQLVHWKRPVTHVWNHNPPIISHMQLQHRIEQSFAM